MCFEYGTQQRVLPGYCVEIIDYGSDQRVIDFVGNAAGAGSVVWRKVGDLHKLVY